MWIAVCCKQCVPNNEAKEVKCQEEGYPGLLSGQAPYTAVSVHPTPADTLLIRKERETQAYTRPAWVVTTYIPIGLSFRLLFRETSLWLQLKPLFVVWTNVCRWMFCVIVWNLCMYYNTCLFKNKYFLPVKVYLQDILFYVLLLTFVDMVV